MASISSMRRRNSCSVQAAHSFDYLIGNQDRHAHNWMIKANGKMLLT